MMCAIQWKATTQYAYEVGGKLKQVTLPDSSTVTYAYDALGNRIRKLSSSVDIHYQYSQGACRREIHKDPATQNILRTITYHPWGMSILENQTSTDYYFITDFRGWVWGLTDDSGTLVESYNYDPFGKILAGSLLSHARFLSGAHEGQWDGEVGLYYLGARYYDPSLGRFIQEDAVEGSADLPASQNRCVYCQNDPVSLIDPTGYSPENTGTPARFNLSNLGNFGGSSSGASSTACILPDTSQFFAKGDGIWWGDNSPSQGSMYCFDASGDYEVVEEGKDSDGNTYYLVTINGETVRVKEDKNGVLSAQALDGEANAAQQSIITGLNDAFKKMTKEGLWGVIGSRLTFLQGIVSFAQQNLGTFAQIIQGDDRTVYCQFMKHATIGKVIADVIKKDPYTGDNDKERKNDHSIAFWVSFYNEKMGYNSTLWTNGKDNHLDENGQYTDDTVLGLIDQVRLMKAIQYKENGSQKEGAINQNTDDYKSKDYGLFQVNDYWFPRQLGDPGRYRNLAGMNFGDLYKTNTFANIGAGVGFLYSYQYEYGGEKRSSAFTLRDAKHSIISYNPGNPLLEKVLTYMNMQNHRFPGRRKP